MNLLRLAVVLAFLLPGADLFAGGKALTIIHTNDLHSHFLGFSPIIDYRPETAGGDETRGGWARVASVINRERASRTQPVLVLDGGDFLMGSTFHLAAREEALELRLMKEMGYDALTLGNHEFDLKPRGLARILLAAAARDGLPPIVFSNAVFSKESDRDDALQELFDRGLVKPYRVLEREGIRIGIFGVMGKDAAEKAPFASPVKFRDAVETAREMVELLRGKEKADLVICLSHSGVKRDKSRSEDEILARKVEGIDVIVGGHSHTRLENPIRVNSTLIVQAWAYGRCVGVLDLRWDRGKVELEAYRLVDVDSSIPADRAIQGKIDSYRREIDRALLREAGLSSSQVVARTSFDLTMAEEESNLGNLVADSIRWYVNRKDSDPRDPATRVNVAIESNGVIRDPLLRGKTGDLAVIDIFGAVPLGIGADDSMAYPLISCYLYASEIKKALEILTSIHPRKGSSYFLQVSGVKFTYNPRRVIFDRVTRIWMGSEEEGYAPLDFSESNRKLYRIATNLYNAAFLKLVGNYTYQILKIVPKDASGAPVEDLAALRVDADKDRPGVQELKEWLGLVEYLRSFPDRDGDGIPDVPEKYRGKLGRIVREASWHPTSLLAGGTRVTWAAVGGVAAALVLLIVAARLLARKVKRRRRGSFSRGI